MYVSNCIFLRFIPPSAFPHNGVLYYRITDIVKYILLFIYLIYYNYNKFYHHPNLINYISVELFFICSTGGTNVKNHVVGQ